MEPTHSRVLVGVVDDHDLLVAGVRALCSASQSPAQFAAGARTVRDLLHAHPRLDVVLLDVRLDDGSSTEENVRQLTQLGMHVILHADRSHREAVPILSRTAAQGLVWKNDSPRDLLRAVVGVAQGERWCPPDAQHSVDLTHRETEVLKLYATGLKYAETAAALQPPISVESVKTYLTRVRKRYEAAGRPASTRLELRRRALEDGLLTSQHSEI